MVIQHPSPNFGPRRLDARPDLVVLHHTAMRTSEAALARLCDPAAEVSAHYLIGEGGRVWQLVAEVARAWHAGAGRWGAVGDVNSRSIGIELANAGPLDDHPPFCEPQMMVLEDLLAGILARWSIPPERVIAHSDIAPGRKSDPGPKFDWRRLARLGLAIAVDLGAESPALVPDAARFRTDAQKVGYGADRDANSPALIAAFRLRHRPGAAEPDLAAADMEVIAALAARYPCVDEAAQPV